MCADRTFVPAGNDIFGGIGMQRTIKLGACSVAGIIALGMAAQAVATTPSNPAPATIYEIRIDGTTRDLDGPGSFAGRNGSVSILPSPAPTLSTSIDVGAFQDETTAFLRYYFRINGPEAVIVPVSLVGKIVLTAHAPDTGQANSYGQIDLTTNFTSDSGHIEIDRGGEVVGTVSSLTPTLHGTIYTNGWGAITLRAGSGARGSSDGGAGGTAFVDPVLSIDQSFFTDSGYDPSRFSLSFSDGFGNDPAAGAVPEPASWLMMVGGFGLIGGALRRRRTSLTFA
jgi:hypothetical protein